MIPLSSPKVQNISWQQQLAQSITDPDELLRILQLPEELRNQAQRPANSFPLRVTRDYLSCIKKGDINDPLLKQVLPVEEENHSPEGFVTDPVGDMHASPLPGLIHKYQGRVLLITTPACAIHCRYCFRRTYPYHESSANKDNLDFALKHIAEDPTIHEVILSGGDPLTMSDERLESLVHRIESIPHVTTLRIHSRLPVVLPARLTAAFKRILDESRLNAVLVIHCNHPNELSDNVTLALQQLSSSKITLLNQSVLLKGVNTEPAVLIELSHRLFSSRVLPYYLHLLDPVSGAAHFHIDDKAAVQLHASIKKELPGYLVPALVREIAGFPYKRDVTEFA